MNSSAAASWEENRLEPLKKRFQLIETDLQGEISQSCETLFPLKRSPRTLYEQLPPLGERARVFERLAINEYLQMYQIQLELGRKSYWADIQVKLIVKDLQPTLLFWVENRTDFYLKQQQEEAQRKTLHENQVLELTNEILLLKRELSLVKGSYRQEAQRNYEQTRIRWYQQAESLHYELGSTSAEAFWLNRYQQLLDIELLRKKAKETLHFPSDDLGLPYETLQHFSTLYSTADVSMELVGLDEKTWLRGEYQRWELTMIKVFSQLLLQGITKFHFSCRFNREEDRLHTVWQLEKESTFSIPQEEQLFWRIEQEASYLSFSQVFQAVVPEPKRQKHVLLQLQNPVQTQQIKQWIEQWGGKVSLEAEEMTKFDLILSQKNQENAYLSQHKEKTLAKTWTLSPKTWLRPLEVYQRLFPDAKLEKTMIPEQPLDLSYIREIVDDQPEMMLNLLGILEKNLEEYPAKMQQEWQTGELLALRETAHKFKSCTAYTNLDAFNKTLSLIESSEETQMPPAELEAHIHDVLTASKDVLRQVRQAMEPLQ